MLNSMITTVFNIKVTTSTITNILITTLSKNSTAALI